MATLGGMVTSIAHEIDISLGIGVIGTRIKETAFRINLESDDKPIPDSFSGIFSQIIITFIMKSLNHTFEDQKNRSG